jgi:hypothetical protein
MAIRPWPWYSRSVSDVRPGNLCESGSFILLKPVDDIVVLVRGILMAIKVQWPGPGIFCLISFL